MVGGELNQAKRRRRRLPKPQPLRRGVVVQIDVEHDVELVGGKNSSLGEMISHLSNAGVSVPGGFATTAAAYREFLDQSGLNARIQAELEQLNVDDVNALIETGAKIRKWIVDTPLTANLEQEIPLCHR